MDRAKLVNKRNDCGYESEELAKVLKEGFSVIPKVGL